jgi:hypothetical protein
LRRSKAKFENHVAAFTSSNGGMRPSALAAHHRPSAARARRGASHTSSARPPPRNRARDTYRQAAFRGQLDDQLPIREKLTCAADEDRVRAGHGRFRRIPADIRTVSTPRPAYRSARFRVSGSPFVALPEPVARRRSPKTCGWNGFPENLQAPVTAESIRDRRKARGPLVGSPG